MIQKKITRAQLTKILMVIKGAKFGTVTIETEPKMRKTNNPYFGNVIKRSSCNYCMGFNYTNSVNNQLKKENKEQTFVAQPRKWGERIDGTCLVLHQNNLYLELKPTGKPQSTEFFLISDNSQIEKDTIQDFLQEPNHSTIQGTDKEILVRDVKVSNIKEIKINGYHYIITN